MVVKLGGRTQSDAALPEVLSRVAAERPGALIIVHGGGDQISALQRLRGEEPVFIGGRRVTTPLALELVRMVLSGAANKQLVAQLQSHGVRAVGISGEDDGMLRARAIDRAQFGFSGTPVGAETRLVSTLLGAGFVPVISPVAASDDEPGQALNVNGDDAAAALAAALSAYELFLLADVPGVLDSNKAVIPVLTEADAQRLIEDGTAAGGMAAKLDASLRALAHGVTRVRIGDLAALEQKDAGTTVTTAVTAP